MRLIDADGLKKKAQMRRHELNSPLHIAIYRCLSTHDVDNAPTVEDAVVVVRCKDCKHWNNGDCYRLELSRPSDFCSYGERKIYDDN